MPAARSASVRQSHPCTSVAKISSAAGLSSETWPLAASLMQACALVMSAAAECPERPAGEPGSIDLWQHSKAQVKHHGECASYRPELQVDRHTRLGMHLPLGAFMEPIASNTNEYAAGGDLGNPTINLWQPVPAAHMACCRRWVCSWKHAMPSINV